MLLGDLASKNVSSNLGKSSICVQEFAVCLWLLLEARLSVFGVWNLFTVIQRGKVKSKAFFPFCLLPYHTSGAKRVWWGSFLVSLLKHCWWEVMAKEGERASAAGGRLGVACTAGTVPDYTQGSQGTQQWQRWVPTALCGKKDLTLLYSITRGPNLFWSCLVSSASSSGFSSNANDPSVTSQWARGIKGKCTSEQVKLSLNGQEGTKEACGMWAYKHSILEKKACFFVCVCVYLIFRFFLTSHFFLSCAASTFYAL